jgi:hypothetical protein
VEKPFEQVLNSTVSTHVDVIESEQYSSSQNKHNMAGGISNCLHEWQAITDSPWVLEVVQGYVIEFDSEPVQLFNPSEIRFSELETSLLDTEIQEMIDMQVIEQAWPEVGQFVSTIFARPKKNGKIRPILNLKGLNRFVKYNHFKMESFAQLLEMIQRGDYFTSLDLTNAYYSIPIHKQSRKYLRLRWKGVLF